MKGWKQKKERNQQKNGEGRKSETREKNERKKEKCQSTKKVTETN